jgi:hypothetical protein
MLMNSLKYYALRRAVRPVFQRNFISVLHQYNSANAEAPLIEKYRPTWPDPYYVNESSSELPPLPPRTVPDEALRFEIKGSNFKGTAEFYTHLPINPADMRVKLKVSNSIRYFFFILRFVFVGLYERFEIRK